MKKTTILLAALSVAGFATQALAAPSMLATARQYVAAATNPALPYTGPTTGPKAVEGKFIVYVSSNQSNGGARGV
ncbi:MAG: sugar ABC transporter substrate-binding protein, partial [Acidiphilium sp. 21-68-69]